MQTFSGFKLVHEQPLPELNSAARFYRHAKTGAELLSLVNDEYGASGIVRPSFDDNKVFGVTFRTPPRDPVSRCCLSWQGYRKCL
jgi:presequence protease